MNLHQKMTKKGNVAKCCDCIFAEEFSNGLTSISDQIDSSFGGFAQSRCMCLRVIREQKVLSTTWVTSIVMTKHTTQPNIIFVNSEFHFKSVKYCFQLSVN